jgi:hypothetical protein
MFSLSAFGVSEFQLAMLSIEIFRGAPPQFSVYRRFLVG